MKVLLSAGMIQGGRSGVGRYVIALVEALRRNHPEIDLHLAGLDADRAHFPAIGDACWMSIPAGSAVRNLAWHQGLLPGRLRQGGYDLVHIPSYRRMLARCPIPQVATIHDCAPFVLRDKYDLGRGLFGTRVVPWIARRVDRVVAVSQTTAADITRYMKVPEARITTLPNGIDHEQFRPSPAAEVEAFRARMRLDRPFFLYVARLEHPAKNHLRLIEAFSELVQAGEFDGDLILPGAAWHGHEVIEEAGARSPVRERIRLEGFVAGGDLPLWYAAAEALVFPSLMEGFGLPILEAQACGTRTASSDATSLPEVAGPAGLLFDGRRVDDLRAAMRRLATMDEAERARRREEGLAWARDFTWDRHAAGVATIYQQLAGS
jgi:glycosyltransferase involved in cell wall biosynthesis